jgi:hypothetical protein
LEKVVNHPQLAGWKLGTMKASLAVFSPSAGFRPVQPSATLATALPASPPKNSRLLTEFRDDSLLIGLLPCQSAIENRQSTIPAMLGRTMLGEILPKTRRISQIVLQGNGSELFLRYF